MRLKGRLTPAFIEISGMLVEEDKLRKACRAVALLILESGISVEKAKRIVAKEYGLGRVPTNLDILKNAPEDIRERIRRILVKKPVKTISGVATITIMNPMKACPHGGCIYCPGGENAPKSHTGEEETVKLARLHDYDPYLQAQAQIERLKQMGHEVDKVELIIIAGTFTALPQGFQRWFIKRCLDAFNGAESESLEAALRRAENSPPIRVSGITVETRPDWAKLPQAQRLLELGVTRVELGVQAIDDEIYEIVNRGHSVEDVVEATQILKDLGFKVGYHLMPNLPGSSIEKDLEMYERIWGDSRFRPDQVKIYPTLVLPGTRLYDLWKSGLYKPYSDEDLVELLARWLELTPPYARIQRIQREIPLGLAVAGNKIPNLREVVEERLRIKGLRCRCIRCREYGHRLLRDGVRVRLEDGRVIVRRYEASGGVEYFISYEDPVRDVLFGFLRLRLPSRALRPELEGAAIIRELHVCGRMIPVGGSPENLSAQHAGIGLRLLREAERIGAEELNARKIVVISGVGVRRYYYRHGYKLDGPYVSKKLAG
jgi:elongator complex protein 3